MNTDNRRLRKLLMEVRRLRGDKEIPTFEQFREEWNTMDELSKSLLECYAGCPELMGEVDEYDMTIFGYLRQMGLAQESCSLMELLGACDE